MYVNIKDTNLQGISVQQKSHFQSFSGQQSLFLHTKWLLVLNISFTALESDNYSFIWLYTMSINDDRENDMDYSGLMDDERVLVLLFDVTLEKYAEFILSWIESKVHFLFYQVKER